MRKSLLTTAILMGLVVSTNLTNNVQAAPIDFSGEVEYEYSTEKVGKESEAEHEVSMELNLKCKPDEKSTVYATAELKNKLKKEDDEEKTEITLENVYLKHKISENLALKVGAQPIKTGKGMWLDADGFTGINSKIETGEVKLNIFGGSNNADDDGPTEDFTVFSLGKDFKGGETAIYTGKQENSKFWGAFAETKISKNVKLSADYVKNTTAKASGYVLEAGIGKAKKVGEFEYGLYYLDMDKELFTSNDYTKYDDNYDEDEGLKGFGAKVGYKVSEATMLEVSHKWGETKTDNTDVSTTKVSMTVEF